MFSFVLCTMYHVPCTMYYLFFVMMKWVRANGEYRTICGTYSADRSNDPIH